MAGCEGCASNSSCSAAAKSACTSNGENSDNDKVQNPNYVKDKSSFLEQHHSLAQIKSVIGVCSGKGGVGKSMVTSTLAVMLARTGLNVGILDADITGPSIPRAFGINGKIQGTEDGIFPASSHGGIQIMSVNLMLDNNEAPVIWRGPVIAGVVKQFWTDVIWDGLDVLLIDMPPGTGDVPLTIFQSIPLDGIVIVTTPQDLVSMIVKKARNMALMMGVKVFGLIENMSYVICPGCDTHYELFGKGKTLAVAMEMGIPLLDKMPIDPKITELSDAGKIEDMEVNYLPNTTEILAEFIANKPDEY